MTNYTIQCKDEISGKVGSFLYDVARFVVEKKFYAIGPVYPDLFAFYKDHEPANDKVWLGYDMPYKRRGT